MSVVISMNAVPEADREAMVRHLRETFDRIERSIRAGRPVGMKSEAVLKETTVPGDHFESFQPTGEHIITIRATVIG